MDGSIVLVGFVFAVWTYIYIGNVGLTSLKNIILVYSNGVFLWTSGWKYVCIFYEGKKVEVIFFFFWINDLVVWFFFKISFFLLYRFLCVLYNVTCFYLWLLMLFWCAHFCYIKVPLWFYVIFLIVRITFFVFIPCTFYPRNFIFEMFRVFFYCWNFSF